MSVEEIRGTGAVQMDDEEVQEYLLSEGVGVLGLPTGDAPYILPMSFGYDGDSRLYFTFLLFGLHSRKVELSDQAETARFLVYHAESMYDWQSVLLTGTIQKVPEDEWDRLQDAMENAWHPDLFAAASPMRGIRGYQFRINEQVGIKHTTP